MEAQKPTNVEKNFLKLKKMSDQSKNNKIQTRPQIEVEFETREKKSHERKEPSRK